MLPEDLAKIVHDVFHPHRCSRSHLVLAYLPRCLFALFLCYTPHFSRFRTQRCTCQRVLSLAVVNSTHVRWVLPIRESRETKHTRRTNRVSVTAHMANCSLCYRAGMANIFPETPYESRSGFPPTLSSSLSVLRFLNMYPNHS